MEIRDLIHGSISVEPWELPIIDSRYFQRLRQIKQLGFAEYSFPSASHNRYSHSLGAMQTASKAVSIIFGRAGFRRSDNEMSLNFKASKPQTYQRFLQVVRLASLLHDVGHGPLSHTTEVAMPQVKLLQLPYFNEKRDRKATHEDYTLKIILDSELTSALNKVGDRLGFNALHVAALIDPKLELTDDLFFKEEVDGETIDFRPILQQLFSSELDADRMDYLRRDSTNAGVSYGNFDYDWLASNLTGHIKNSKCYLTLQHRAIYAFEDFLISRYNMFLMVYFHYKSVVFDEMLAQYLASPHCDYKLPADIDKYCDCTDSELFSHLSKSKSSWARRIADKKPYRILLELHSGVPATRSAQTKQERLLTSVESDLKNRKIHYLTVTSTSELSKYFEKEKDPIYIRYDNFYNAPDYIPLEKCTDLFERYREKRSITRLYVSPEDYLKCKNEGRATNRHFEDPATAPTFFSQHGTEPEKAHKELLGK